MAGKTRIERRERGIHLDDPTTRARAVLILVLSSLCCASLYHFHFAAGKESDITYLFYIPVILAGLWWGWRGMVVTVSLGGFLGAARLLFPTGAEADPNAWLQLALFLLIGYSIAWVSERRDQAMATLRERERNYRILEENTTDVIWTMDMDLSFTYISPSVEQMRGYTPEEAAAQSLEEAMTPASAAHVRRVFAEELALEKRGDGDPSRSRTLEAEMRRKDGTTVWVEVTMNFLRDDRGQPTGILGVTRDITERRRAQERLREAKEMWKEIFQASGHPIFVLDPSYRITKANLAAYEALGGATKPIIGRPCYELMHGTPAPPPDCPMRQILEGRCRGRAEAEQEALGRTWLVSCSPVLDREGRPLRVVHIATDIQKLKETERALALSEEKFRLLVEEIHETIYSTDREGILTYVSPAIERLTGYTPEEVVGRRFTEVVHPEDLPRVEKSFLQLSRKLKGLHPIEYRLLHRSGQTRWVRTYARPFFENGAFAGVRGAMSDISDRKRWEAMLRESESKFRALFHLSPQPIMLTEEDGRTILDVNEAFCRLSKWSRHDLIGKSWRQIGAYLSPEDEAETLKKFKESGELDGLERRFRDREGNVQTVLLFAKRIEFGRRRVIFTVLLDITDRKDLERQLRVAQRMEAIGTLASGIAHDFNNILAAVNGFTELALAEAPEGGTLRANLEEVLRAGDRAADLVQHILAFSRQAEQERKPIQVHLIVKEALKLIRAALPTTVEIRQRIEADADTILGDPTQIHQVLMNLCTNAGHAMRQNGGVLEVGLHAVRFEPGEPLPSPDLRPGAYLELSVRDTGHGMDEAVMERIFDPFFTTKEAGEGTGMGLSVVHGIVKAHQGAITVTSQPGLGTTFRVYFPLLERTEARPEPEPSRPPQGRGQGRILLVDDEEALVRFGCKALERLGYEVVPRTNSLQALQEFLVQPDRTDLVITDLTMPLMNGIDLSREILRVRPDTPIILCTGLDTTLDVDRIRELGIRKTLRKPVRTVELANAVQELLRDKARKGEGLCNASSS